MTSRSLKLAASAFTAVLTLVSAASAQGFIGQTSKIDVPFAFEVGSTHFQPGTYSVRLVSEHMLCVQGTGDSANLMVNLDTRIDSPRTGKVVFQHVGGQYFLTDVWTADTPMHLAAFKTPEQKRAIKLELAAGPQAPQTTTVATR